MHYSYVGIISYKSESLDEGSVEKDKGWRLKYFNMDGMPIHRDNLPPTTKHLNIYKKSERFHTLEAPVRSKIKFGFQRKIIINYIEWNTRFPQLLF